MLWSHLPSTECFALRQVRKTVLQNLPRYYQMTWQKQSPVMQGPASSTGISSWWLMPFWLQEEWSFSHRNPISNVRNLHCLNLAITSCWSLPSAATAHALTRRSDKFSALSHCILDTFSSFPQVVQWPRRAEAAIRVARNDWGKQKETAGAYGKL